MSEEFGFAPGAVLDNGLGRTGTIRTPHGEIQTPAFVVVGTKATVKAVLPDDVAALGAQAVLANAYHLYLQPGSDLVDEAGGLGRFMNWSGPTFTDSGGFQVMSLGAGFKKVLAMETERVTDDQVIAEGKERLAHVDDDGVTFKSHLDGTRHRFTPEVSMRVQHELGADIMFAFDELTTLMNTRAYQEESLERTRLWAERCLAAHRTLTEERVGKPYQALFGVLQGAQYEDLRRKAARDLGSMEVNGQTFDGFGIGGALEKENLGTIVGWVAEELPFDKPRHLLGISEPDDLFAACAAGADTFDCVNPSRVARNAAIYAADGRYNVNTAANRRAFVPLEEGCDCYTCTHYTRAYLHHLFKAKEMLASTLATIHNERFTVRLVDRTRESMQSGDFDAYREEFLGRFYASRG
ncbi:tRNA guanosine(34) transglycosylase Tgt [Aestuariimicrobium sp. p3-SID1156]|uniref:tRNA guanosine(34) transglycosylase Tgt n=1 Tax=Aestuariimicrobium sp. p3-SID1156 TaxID=2916038 RepID=UPI00223C2ECD|nr:tRNA guanosine(34) transglycosylase Tgt [Aestuariimicrobium sp. p3-SID1156]MCT1459256.1 tRNA guanosine(34) transglycosylase Tgt [Aestuariimicrobium sp. p3-SID1156]